MIHRSGAGHTGGALSTVDILVSLFYHTMSIRPAEPEWKGRDRFILSKGHSCEGYYQILADLGYFDRSELDGFMGFRRMLAGHPHTKIPGVEVSTGSLGHGLPSAAGMALAAKMKDEKHRIFCLLGDGELGEGSVWEAASFASHRNLSNLVCIVDRNRLQITGETKDVLSMEPLEAKFESFGFEVRTCDGHDIGDLTRNFSETPWDVHRPSVLIAETTKGKGVSFMEGQPHWHHRVPSKEELSSALSELESEAKTLSGGV